MKKGKKEVRKREKLRGLIPNKSGLVPDKTSHNVKQSQGYYNARGNHEGCWNMLIRDSTHLPPCFANNTHC